MDIASPVGSTIERVGLGFLSPADIRKLSVKQITNPEVFDNLGHPVSGGLYDLALGAFLRSLCATCGLDDRKCPGHLGHIDLPVPLYNPMFFGHMFVLLRSCCLFCHRFRLRSSEVHLYVCKLRLLQYGLMLEAQQVGDLRGDTKYTSSQAEIDVDADVDAAPDDEEDRPEEAGADELFQVREQFVKSKIESAIKSGFAPQSGIQTPTVSSERKAIIKDLYARLIARPRCNNCGMYSPKFRKDGLSKIFERALTDRQARHNQSKGVERQVMVSTANKPLVVEKIEEEQEVLDVPKTKGQNGNRFVLSSEVYNHLRRVFHNEQDICRVMFHMRPTTQLVSADIFFVHQVVVPPTRFRLPSELGDEVHMNPMTELLSKVLQSCLRIRDLSEEVANLRDAKIAGEQRKLAFTQLMNQFVSLQNDFNGIIDSTKNQNTPVGATPLPGIKQALERKEGLFRKNMMGKRVNYAARSVISPDPNLETNEIGIPPVFATKLTYPEPVTSYNVEELRKCVMNGADVWPGATMVQHENGQLVSLAGMTIEQRTAVANQLQTPSTTNAPLGVNKKVYRHIRNRDVVLMNRQPTLHKASMMGHTVRVLPKEKTLRLHYANTGAYNADFDGDEMNMHFPQSEAARAEALLLANTNSQYLTPTSGKPLRGLIQDHISAGVWLTSKNSFFSRDEYHQLVYGSIRPESGQFASERVLTVPPAVMKPQPLWTGKQVISTILLNVKPADRPGLNLDSKNKVKGEYWGAAGAEENAVVFRSGELLCGILDKSQYGAADYGLVHAVHELYGADSAGLLLSVLGRLFTKYNMHLALTCGMDDLRLTEDGDQWRRELLEQANGVGLVAATEVTNMPPETTSTDKEFRRRLEEILRDDNKLAVLDAITQNKASSITTQVVAKCIPAGTAKQFPYNNMQSMALSGAKGSNVNVSQIMCGLGQQALEGRRVPVMVSGKTLPSFKPFETHVRAGGYIGGRFYSGIRPQEYYFHCMAGREGLIDTAVKTSRSGYLQRCLIKQLEGVRVEYDNTVRDSDGTLVQFLYGGDSVDTIKESYLRQFDFCAANVDALKVKHTPSVVDELDDERAASYAKKLRKHPELDPVTSVLNPQKYIGSISESFEKDLGQYADQKWPSAKKDRRRFKSLMQLKYQQSTVDPGECVGIVASQSIGEPSTQMTLNTFHFAGHGAANVTLGIPRMREIIMTASPHIKTPQMVLPLRSEVSDAQADVFAKSVSRIMLSQLIDKIVVTERTGLNEASQYVRAYRVRLQLFSCSEYEEEYDILQREVEDVLSGKFLSMLEDAVTKETRRQRKVEQGVVVSAVPDTATVSSRKAGEGNVDDDEADASEASENESDDGDSDIEAKKEAERGVAYDLEDDEDEPVQLQSIHDTEAMEADASEDESGSDKDNEDFEDEAPELQSPSPSSDESDAEPRDDAMEVDEVDRLAQMTKAQTQRQSSIVSRHRTVRRFNFDDADSSWCEFELEYPARGKKLLMVNLLEALCRRVVVREVPQVERALRPTQHKAGRVIVTEGVNFSAMWQEDMFVDVDGITSNDVAAVLHTYGVEAARATIAREISNVFETYAIAVNPRHLELIADMMTRDGTYLPFSRQGLESGTSPFLKMSFESTCQFLTRAVLEGATENLDSPSARIVVGRPIMGGTGSFDVLQAAV
uniref:DNA-directed RNA polymerase subunit n=1 Tax=Wickerhamiella domercqiae TaxID=45788 RepID=A0A0P0HX50_WICDO|nr:RNA polymerase I largest subunit [Wickerhamiella domercqiae]